MRLATTIAIVLLLMSRTMANAASCAAANTQMEMNDCAAADLRAADTRLNTTYNEVTARLRGLDQSRRLLVASENAWIQFRDAECEFATNQSNGGSAHPMVLAECKAAVTKDRIKQLRGYLDCQEGDLSCPLPPK